jgi:hypothetical protein
MTIGELYVKTCNAYGRTPNADQGSSWLVVLGSYGPTAVENAIRSWQGNQTLEYDGRPRGSRFPMPADIRMMIETEQRSDRHSNASAFIPCEHDGCVEGWRLVFQGKTAGSTVHPEGTTINPKFGAVRRCACWTRFLCGVYHCEPSDLTAVLQRKTRHGGGRRRPSMDSFDFDHRGGEQ